MIKYGLILLFSISLQAQTVNVECHTGECIVDPGTNPNLLVNTPNYSTIDLGYINNPLNVTALPDRDPQSLRLYMENGEVPGKNVYIDLSAGNDQVDSANLILIGDNFDSMVVKLNGYDGEKGKDASEICADNIKSLKYGATVFNAFNTRRSGSNGADPDRCEQADLNFLQENTFSCDEVDYNQIAGAPPVVDAVRIKPKARCQGFFRAKICEKRETKLRCEFKVWNAATYMGSGPSYGWGTTIGASKFYTNRQSNYSDFRINDIDLENYIQNLRNVEGLGGTDEDLLRRYCHDNTNMDSFEISSTRKMLYHYGNSHWPLVAYSSNNFGGLSYEEKQQCISNMGYSDVSGLSGQTPAYKNFSLVNGHHAGSPPLGVVYSGDRRKDSHAFMNALGSGGNSFDVCSWQPYNTELTELGVTDTLYIAGNDSCPSGYEEEDIQYSIVTAYDENDNLCDDVSHPSDPLNQAVWTFTGYDQLEEFENQTITCSVNSCILQTNITDLEYDLDKIEVENGKNGTQKGGAVIFAYSIQNQDIQTIQGQAGPAGKDDINLSVDTRTCAKVNDVISDGRASDFAKDPQISFKRYSWKAITTTGGGVAGIPPQESTKETKVYKKIDSSLRNILRKELLFGN
tara:strand:- start:846 stop:2732 length:1887 start_codon:yes stop_codon:yes gene_type:complete